MTRFEYTASHLDALANSLKLEAASIAPGDSAWATMLCVAKSLGNVSAAIRSGTLDKLNESFAPKKAEGRVVPRVAPRPLPPKKPNGPEGGIAVGGPINAPLPPLPSSGVAVN